LCGLAGILHFGRLSDANNRVVSMANSIAHRGPDDEGVWFDNDVALGFRRLAILDQTKGAQPMSNEDGTVCVIFNGEIYNHKELRLYLESRGHRFRSDHSDTEVLIHGWIEWGEALPEKLNGMFAFVIWDKRNQCLILARDRLGIKPLYITRDSNNNLLFGAEIRAIYASGLVEKKIRPEGILEYLTLHDNWFGRTPYENVNMLEPGTIQIHRIGKKQIHKYWSMEFSRSNQESLTTSVEKFRNIFLDVIARQIDADVPVASYLSGGIDSTAITIGANELDRNIKAYSCIFDLTEVGEDKFVDEREYSREISAITNIARVEHKIHHDELIECLDRTISALEYPRMGMAYVNNIISERVSQDAKVVLSGLGGDEFHAGYIGRYAITPRNNKRGGIRGILSMILNRPQIATEDCLKSYRHSLNYPIKLTELDEALTPEFRRAAEGFSADDAISDLISAAPSSDPWDIVMYGDCQTYLHGLLVLEDKLSMSHSLETRVPLLDNEIIDNALCQPWEYLTDGITGKIIFREAVKPWVPQNIYSKPKMGFAPPDASWYRGPLKGWIEEQLSEKNIASHGILKPSFVRKKLDEHFSGLANHVVLIWSFLSLESWSRLNKI